MKKFILKFKRSWTAISGFTVFFASHSIKFSCVVLAVMNLT